MHAEKTWRRRKLIKEAQEHLSLNAFVDMGVLLRVVEQDPSSSLRPIPGMEAVRVLDEIEFGGVVDTRRRQIVRRSSRPVIWYAGREQTEQIVPAADAPPRQIVFGAEGAGKTRVLSKWTLRLAIGYTGLNGTIGCTAPTGRRMQASRGALKDDMPPDWYREIKSEGLFVLANGIQIFCVSTHKYSEEAGSPLQSYTFLACASDELQDSTEADPDIETRGRGAPGGVYRRLCTSTSKDSPDWRTVLATKRSLPQLWSVSHLPGTTNPFVAQLHWRNLRVSLSDREYRRRVLAQDVGPERMLYHTWDRATHVQPLPFRAKDVTAQILRRFGLNRTMLVGYDPGQLYEVAVLLKAYLLPKQKRHTWWIVGEFVKEQTTAHSFAYALREHLREHFDLMESDSEAEVASYAKLPQVIADPASDSSQNQPDEQIYKVFKRLGFPIRPAAYSKTNPTKHGRIPKESRIETICNLLMNAAGEARLFALCDDRRRPCCPRFVNAIETQARDADGKAETQAKNRRDVSHYTAAPGYALWPLERTTVYPLEEPDLEAA